jgi:hypothetical protein
MLFSSYLFAQTRGNSPYTLYGIGFKSEVSNGKSFSMGGIGIAFQDNTSINPLNPAATASLDSLSFIFDAGFVMNSSKFSSTTANEKGNYASLNYLLFGFQVAKPWKTSFGLVPYSDVGYSTVTNDEMNNISFTDIYTGNGGLNKAFWIHAFNIIKNISIGIESGLLFGQIERNYIRILNIKNVFSIKESNTDTYKKFYLKYGLQYTRQINKEFKLIIGAIASTNMNVNTDRKYILQTFLSGVSVENHKESSITGKTLIPANFGLGFMLSKKNHWKVGIDLEKQYWSDYSSFDNVQPFKNSFRFAIGGELIPNANSIKSYFQHVSYRFGFRYEKTPIYLNNTLLNEIGISFGVGLPFKKTASTVNLGIEIGQRGTSTNSLIKETFIKFKVGISMFQQWFRQQKYQ